jgi:predicted aldo/keto reductase-like oxidoreductase
MKYRRFGRTDVPLSLFTLGTMRYLASEDNAEQTIRRAIALGINHLETARGYGKSELFLGRALRQGVRPERSPLFITTKSPPTPDADTLERQIDRSLDTLGIDAIDFFALHGVNTAEHLAWIEAEQGCMRAVRRALDDGRIRHVGFSTHAPLEIIVRAIATDQFAFVNLHYNLFFQRNAPAVQLAHQKDMGVFIISPADKGGMLYTPSERLQRLCHPFTPLELGYRFLMSDRRITTLSVGAATPQELELPLQYADRDDPIQSQEQAAFDRLIEQQRQALNATQCSQCYQCLPCPEEIHIPEVLRLRNLAIAYDMTAYGTYRYGMFENAGHWFPGKRGDRCTECGDCLPRCPEQLAIPDLLQDAHQRLGGQRGRRLWE